MGMKYLKKIKLVYIISVVLFFSFISNANAGRDASEKNKYKQAEQQLSFDNFDKALQLYSDLFEKNSENYNFAYKIGYCYLTGEKFQDVDSAIEYFLIASEHVNKRYKNKFREKDAPVNTFYYLGVAYRLNKDFEKAIKAFNTYSEKMSNKERKTVQGKFIDREIQSCKDAMEIIDSERMKIERIIVNDLQEPSVRCPILCFDANRLIFTNGKYNVFPPDINYNTEYSEGPFDGVYMADRQEDGSFDNPINITNDLEIPYPFIPVTATSDGSELYLVADRYDNGDIYMSKYENGKYQPAERVKKLNTRKWESHATITADGKRIYFTSLRKGGEGGLDIWYSDRDEEGEWQKPINAGSQINTPFHEEMPYIIRNGHAMYFSSESHTNVGGFDVFYTNWDDQSENWSKPVNLSYPFSTAGNDMGYIIENTPVFAFCPVNDNKRREGVEDCDCISLEDEEAPQMAKISGIIELDPENQEKLMGIRVKLIDKESGESIADVSLDENGKYVIEEVGAGQYDLIAYDDTGDLMVRSMEVPQNEVWDITGVDMKISTENIASVVNTDVNNNVENSQIVGFKNIFFGNNSDVIEDKFDSDLNQIADYLKNNPDSRIEIQGYCSQTGPIAYNMQLSESRAQNVKEFLVNNGVNENQVQIKGYGFEKPIAINDFPDSQIYNRRTEIVFLNDENINPIQAYVPTYYRAVDADLNYDNGKFFYCEIDVFNDLVAECVFFDFDEYDINLESKENLDFIADYLISNPQAKFKLSGHTDHYGTDNYNMELSQNRVVQVQDYLVGKGVNSSQLEIEFLGEKENITVATDDDMVRRLNRRVNVYVVEQGEPPIRVAPIIVPEEYRLTKTGLDN